MDRNPRTIPARAAAQAGIVGGILMAVVGVTVLVLALTLPDFPTFARDIPVWPAAAGIAIVGAVSIASGMILLRIVHQRDRERLIAKTTAG